MNHQQFTIHSGLPSMNEVIDANRRTAYAGAKLKRDAEKVIFSEIRAAHMREVKNPCIVHMLFIEGDRRRDVDNVEGAKKFILDALVRARILQGDSPRYVIGTPSFTRYGKSRSVIVTLIEGENEEALRRKLQSASDFMLSDWQEGSA